MSWLSVDICSSCAPQVAHECCHCNATPFAAHNVRPQLLSRESIVRSTTIVDNLIVRNILHGMNVDSDDVLRLDRQICFRLYAASNLLTRLYRPVLTELGLTYPQYLVMLTLWESAPQSVGDIGERLYLDSGTLTPLLKRLEIAGLVSRERDTADERRVLVTLTKAGRALKQQAKKVPSTLARGLNLQPPQVMNLRKTVDDMIGVLLSSVQD